MREKKYHKDEVYHRDEVYLKNQDQFRNIFKITFKKVLKYKKKGRVLEIGSSTGLLLELFQKSGWIVQGVEPSEKSSMYSKKLGIPTIIETFEKAQIKEKFDVIILNHVLEHLENPAKALEKAHSLLDIGGIIVINVPNAGSLSARIYGDSWEYLLPNEHLWQFTPPALFKLLNNAGFKVVEWSATSGIWEYDNPVLEVWQSFIGFKKRLFRNLFTAIPSWLITQAKLGTGLSIIARKV